MDTVNVTHTHHPMLDALGQLPDAKAGCREGGVKIQSVYLRIFSNFEFVFAAQNATTFEAKVSSWVKQWAGPDRQSMRKLLYFDDSIFSQCGRFGGVGLLLHECWVNFWGLFSAHKFKIK